MTGLLKNLFNRRVPQIVGVYLAVGWGVLEFTDWLVNRYILSPHLTDLGLVVWAAMIPTVLMLAYFHGAPGADRWTRFEKIGIPINLALAAVLVVVMFGGKDLGAATTAVAVETEEGDTIKRVVPKAAFRKSLAVYYFDNESSDTTLDWLQYGIVVALLSDLQQDHFVSAQFAPYFAERLETAGYADGLRVPLTLRQEIAEDQHLDYFVSGTIARQGEQLTIGTSLYETRRGKLLQQRRFTGSDLFALIDEMAVQLKRDLEIPAQHIENVKDLPIAETMTGSLRALRAHVDGFRAWTVDEDWPAATRGFERAVTEDSSFASAYASLYAVYLAQNDLARAQAALTKALELSYKLPERSQFGLKSEYYYIVKEDVDRAQAVAAMHAELFPDDVQARQRLAGYYELRDQKDRAIAEYETILKLDPTRTDYRRRIGRIYQSMGRFEEARRNFERYAELHPTDHRSFVALADLHARMGDHERAKAEYERALLLESDNIDVMIAVAGNHFDLGEFTAAERQLDEALNAAKTLQQQANVYNALRSYNEGRGRMNEATRYLELEVVAQEKFQPPLSHLVQRMNHLDVYVKAGREDVALQTLEEIEAQVQAPFDGLLGFGAAMVFIELEDPDQLDAAVDALVAGIDRLGFEQLRYYSIYARGRALEFRGECQQAIVAFQTALELEPTYAEVNTDIGRCYRSLDDLARAEEHILQALKIHPHDAETLLEAARTLAAAGQTESALQHLNKALTVWENADAGFKPAREAHALLAELSASG